MIKPVNGHLLIQPLAHDTFMQSERQTYTEIGTVIAFPREWTPSTANYNIPVGSRVYFDSWLAAKYPVEGKPDEFYWLVKWEDVRAVEHAEDTSQTQ